MKHFFAVLLVGFGTITLVAQPPNYVPTSGLVGWWPFNGNAVDESGNGHDLTVNGATLTADRNGQMDAAHYFDGNGAHMNGGSHADFEILGSRTLSVWVRNGTSFSIDQGIVAYHPNTAPLAGHPGYDLRRRFPDGGSFAAYEDSVYCCWGGPYGAVFSDATYGTGAWHHLVHWRNGTVTRLYVDGVLQSGSYDLTPRFEGSVFLVGWTGSTGQFYHGEIDDIGFWDRALTPGEIQQVFQAGGPGDCLVASYLFEGNADDMTGNGHDGTVYGAIPAVGHDGGGCYEFDGVDDWIRLAGGFNSNTGTVSAWINMPDMSTFHPVFCARDTTVNGIGMEMAVDPNEGPEANRLSYGFDHRDCVGGGCNVFFELGVPQLTPNAWHHVAVASDGAEVTLYIDCVPVSTYFGSCGESGGLWFDDLCQDIVFMIGRKRRLVEDWYFAGRIDDVQIFDCALDSAEISALCDFSTSIAQATKPQGIIAYPNPADGLLWLKNVKQGATLQIFDATGRLQPVSATPHGLDLVLDVSGYPVGTYMIRAGEQGVRFVKQ